MEPKRIVALRPFLAVLALLSFSLAGCSGGGGKGGPDDDPTAGLGLEATDTTGVIRGVVVDQAIVPVQDVVISISTTDLSTKSNEVGAFGFEGLEPGTYFLTAHKAGYADIQQSTVVEADVAEPPIVKIQLVADPSSAPSYEIFEFHGYLECNVAVPLLFFTCTDPVTGEPIGNDNFQAAYTLGGNASFLHVSLVWDPSQPVGTELYYNICDVDAFCDSLESIREAQGGTGPLVSDLNETQLKEINESGGVGIQVSGNGEMGLAGVEYQQRFDAYIVAFHGFVPPEGYAFHKDGAPVLPA